MLEWGRAASGHCQEVRARQHICAAGFLCVSMGEREQGCASKQTKGPGGPGRTREERGIKRGKQTTVKQLSPT